VVILHYAGIAKNNASGVSVIVPQIIDSHTMFAEVGLFNYGKDCFDTVNKVVRISDFIKDDNYRNFPTPFNKPDIVLFHSPFAMPRIMFITNLLKKDNIPYVVVPHGCFSSYAMKNKSIKKYIARLVYMDRVVANAAKMQYLSNGEQGSSVYNKEFFVVPNGIDIKPYTSRDAGKDMLQISFIGRKDAYHKGLDFLIEACGKVKDRLLGKACIKIYGPATEEQSQQIKRLISDFGVDDVVFDLPAVFAKEKVNVYQNTDVVVLTSRFEGQPVAILEAWSYGVPTLVTPGTNVSEECESNGCGWAVSQNVEAIAQKLLYLIENREEIAKCSENAYEYVCREYNWNRISDRYREEFLSILKK
jgi:glycosyltransferase involved in cell wall biosynthesis